MAEAKSSWYEEDEHGRYKVDVSDERVSLEITDDQQVAVWSHDHSCSLEEYLADAPKPRKDSMYQFGAEQSHHAGRRGDRAGS